MAIQWWRGCDGESYRVLAVTLQLVRGVVTFAIDGVCFLESRDRSLFALHGAGVEPFPFSLVTAAFNAAAVSPGVPVMIEPGWCTIGSLRVPVRVVSVADTTVHRGDRVPDAAVVLAERNASRDPTSRSIAREFEVALAGDPEAFARTIAMRIGRGRGLTPSADDIVLGLASGLQLRTIWADHLVALQSVMGSVAPGQTTDVSLALLRSAAEERFPPALAALCKDLFDAAGVESGFRRVARIGAGSGRDMIAGLAISLRVPPGDTTSESIRRRKKSP
jgi:hypothetical protein